MYHCVSRTVGDQFLFGDEEKFFMEQQLYKVALFCGVELITYVFMSNHFHLLIRVYPKTNQISDIELVRRADILYPRGSKEINRICYYLQSEEPKNKCAAIRFRRERKQLRESMIEQMNDLSMFMKLLKMRISKGYNGRNGRHGALWSERFKSVLVENDPRVVLMNAEYIDLNPVRARMVDDPKDYLFSGYGKAVRGNKMMREGLMSIGKGEFNNGSWSEFQSYYRKQLFRRGACQEKPNQAVISNEKVHRVMHLEDGNLSIGEELGMRIDHFVSGVVIGSKSYVEAIFEKFLSVTKDGYVKKKRRRIEAFLKAAEFGSEDDVEDYVVTSLRPVRMHTEMSGRK